MIDPVGAIVQVAINTVHRPPRATELGGGSDELCLIWPAIYAPTWIYWWRLVIVLVLLALIQALVVLAGLAG